MAQSKSQVTSSALQEAPELVPKCGPSVSQRVDRKRGLPCCSTPCQAGFTETELVQEYRHILDVIAQVGTTKSFDEIIAIMRHQGLSTAIIDSVKSGPKLDQGMSVLSSTVHCDDVKPEPSCVKRQRQTGWSDERKAAFDKLLRESIDLRSMASYDDVTSVHDNVDDVAEQLRGCEIRLRSHVHQRHAVFVKCLMGRNILQLRDMLKLNGKDLLEVVKNILEGPYSSSGMYFAMNLYELATTFPRLLYCTLPLRTMKLHFKLIRELLTRDPAYWSEIAPVPLAPGQWATRPHAVLGDIVENTRVVQIKQEV